MKVLLLLVAVFVLLWLLRGSARRMRAPPQPPAAPAPQRMVACAQCGVHLPAGDALPGRGGVFCGADHRDAFEAAHPR